MPPSTFLPEHSFDQGGRRTEYIRSHTTGTGVMKNIPNYHAAHKFISRYRARLFAGTDL